MALANRVFTSRVAEYQNSAVADHNYENDNIQMFRMNDTSNYQDLQTNRIPIYQKLAPTSQIEFTSGPPRQSNQVLPPGVVRLSLQEEESQPRISRNYEQMTANENETKGEHRRSHPHLFSDQIYCRPGKKVLLITFFAMLFCLLSVLVILLITGNIGT